LFLFVNTDCSGNFIKVYSNNIWEPIGFRGGGFAIPPLITPTLKNFIFSENTVGCTTYPGIGTDGILEGGTCQVINLWQSNIESAIIDGNNFYENTSNMCAIRIGPNFTSFLGDGKVPIGSNNTNPGNCSYYS
jgi:hypothetical protein